MKKDMQKRLVRVAKVLEKLAITRNYAKSKKVTEYGIKYPKNYEATYVGIILFFDDGSHDTIRMSSSMASKFQQIFKKNRTKEFLFKQMDMLP